MKRSLLCGTVSVLALTLASNFAQAQAQAQDQSNQSAQNVESVTVTGVRASVEGALTVKQNAGQELDSIVSEDIGKLPDNTVVEALQHVSGIAIVRNSVEPSQVLIRGLPDIATLLNGREIFSTTGRFVSLPDFPAELLAQVDVHKASAATDIEGGIAGLIDIRLHRPFDFEGAEVAGSLQAVNESLAGHVDPQGSVLVSDRWTTDIGDIGALLDISYKSIHNQEDQILDGPRSNLTAGPIAGAGLGPLPVCNNGATCPTSGITTGTGVRAGYAALPNTVTFYQRAGLIERASVDVSAQWRPIKNIETYAEFFYTRLRQKAPTDVDVLLDGTLNNPSQTSVLPGTNIAQNFNSAGYSITSLQDLRQKEDTYQAATGAQWQIDENFMVKTELDETVSQFKSTNYIPDTEYNTPGGLQVQSNYGNSGGTYINTPGAPQLNPANEFSDQWYDQENVRRGSELDYRIDGEYDFAQEDYIKSIEFGYRIADRTAENFQPSNSGIACAGIHSQPNLSYNQYIVDAINDPTGACAAYNKVSTATSVGGISLASLPAGAFHTNHGSFFDGQYGVSNWINVDPEWLVANVNTFRALYGYTGPQAFVPTFTYSTREISNAGYAKANYGLDIYGIPVDGNFGFRLIETQLTENANTQFYNAVTCTPGSVECLTYTPVQGVQQTTDFLPSFNFRATLDTGLFLRFAASETVTHPTFAQLNPGLTLSAPTATLLGTASSGNPNLKPEKSQNNDIDLEYYWGTANHASVALFDRYVEGYIETVASASIINGQTYQLSQPANVQNGRLDGVEVGYSQFLDFLPDFWSGFGWDLNGNYVSGPFNLISKYHFNGAGIYEYGPYSVRLSYTWSSSYQVGAINTGGAQPQISWADPRENMDFSFNYRLTDQLTATFDATNIINSMYKDHYGIPSSARYLYPEDIEEFDKTFSIGIRYRM